MAIDYDLTGKSVPVFGVQTYTNCIRQFAFDVNVAEIGATTASKVYGICTVPAGNAVVGVKIVVTTAAAGGGSLTFGVVVGESTTTIPFGSACAASALAKGVIVNRTLDGQAVVGDGKTTFVITQGSTACSAFGATVILDCVPVTELTTKG